MEDKRKQQNKTEEKAKEKDFWDDAKANISESAKNIGEEVKYLGKKMASYSETIFGKIKDNTKEVIKYGLDLTKDGVHQAQEMAENLKDDIEIRKFNTKKKEVSAQMGMKFYLEIKNNNNQIPENLMQDNEVISLLKELEKLDKEILKRSEESKK